MNPLIMLEEENEILRRQLTNKKNIASEAMYSLRVAMHTSTDIAEIKECITDALTILSKI